MMLQEQISHLTSIIGCFKSKIGDPDVNQDHLKEDITKATWNIIQLVVNCSLVDEDPAELRRIHLHLIDTLENMVRNRSKEFEYIQLSKGYLKESILQLKAELREIIVEKEVQEHKSEAIPIRIRNRQINPRNPRNFQRFCVPQMPRVIRMDSESSEESDGWSDHCFLD